MNGQKRCSRSCSPFQKHTKVKGGAERPSKSRSKSPDHDHITPRETFPIRPHDNAETPKMLNNQKNLYQQRDIQDRDQNQGQDHDPHPKH